MKKNRHFTCGQLNRLGNGLNEKENSKPFVSRSRLTPISNDLIGQTRSRNGGPWNLHYYILVLFSRLSQLLLKNSIEFRIVKRLLSQLGRI